MTNKFIIGSTSAPLFTIQDADIRLGTITGIRTSSLVGDELAIDEMKVKANAANFVHTVYQTTTDAVLRDNAPSIYALNEIMDPGELTGLFSIPFGTRVFCYQNGTLIDTMYFASAERVSKWDYTLTFVSAIGLLDKQTHMGGVYSGSLLSTVLSSIIGSAFTYTVASDIQSIRVYGWLPIETRREALHQVLFAHGINLIRGSSGNISFNYLQQSTSKSVPDDRIFLGGTAEYTPPATSIEVTEHSFYKLADDERIVLFDNTDGGEPASRTLIAFDEAPVYDILSNGLTVHSSGVNYAIITGSGTLTGKRYNHQRQIVTRAGAEGTEKAIRSDRCTLVSVLNSGGVTRRLLSYYSSAQTIKADIIRNGERPGDQLTFNSPFGERVTGFLASQDFRITSFERARCEIVTGYEPTGGDYQNRVMITSSRSWSVPSGITEVMLIIIGGGQGGRGGYPGTAGTAAARRDHPPGESRPRRFGWKRGSRRPRREIYPAATHGHARAVARYRDRLRRRWRCHKRRHRKRRGPVNSHSGGNNVQFSEWVLYRNWILRRYGADVICYGRSRRNSGSGWRCWK